MYLQKRFGKSFTTNISNMLSSPNIKAKSDRGLMDSTLLSLSRHEKDEYGCGSHIVIQHFCLLGKFPLIGGEKRIDNGTTTGPTAKFRTPYDAFTAIWRPDILEVITVESYAMHNAATMLTSGLKFPSGRITHWKDTSAEKLIMFFSIILAMGVVVKSRLEEYWSKSKVLLVSR